MIIRQESYLRCRNIRIHEAGHFAIGTILRLPMALPEVFRDGSGGVAPFAWDEVEECAAKEIDVLHEMELGPKAATNIASMYLAGFAAEAIASKTPWEDIIGGRTHDLSKAVEVLQLVGLHGENQETHLKLAWITALTILSEQWKAVCQLADMIPETDGTHHPPIFH